MTDGEGAVISDGGSTLSEAIDAVFSANEAGSTFECDLDGAGFVPCTSPQSYADLAEADHTLEVRATDPSGNVELTPASFSWTVLTPVQAIENLAQAVIDLGLPNGTQNSLLRPLTGKSGAVEKLEDANPDSDEAAIGKLQEFISKVEDQRGVRLTDAEADRLIDAANEIIADIDEDILAAALDD